MEALKSSFLHSFLVNPSPKTRKLNKPSAPKILCCLKSDPWSPRSGNNLDKPKPKYKSPKRPLSDDNARRIIKTKAKYLSALRRNQGSHAQTPRWIKRTPEQMAQYLEDDRDGHLYERHIVEAIKRVRSTSQLREGVYEMREVMGPFVEKLSFREMCVVLKELKSWRQIRDFFSWMKLQLIYRPSVIAYTIVMRAYGQSGKLKLAEETFLEMLEARCEPDEAACGTMLCAYARWGRHTAMLSFYSAVQHRGVLPPVSVFNFMLSSLQKKSLHRDVVYVWRKMVDQRVGPNHFTYTVAIASLVMGGMGDEALETFHEMKKLGFVPEESTYSLLIGFISKNGEKARAQARAQVLYEDMRSHKIVPSNFTCASLLALYDQNTDYARARSLFAQMYTYNVIADEVIYGLMIRIYGKLGLYNDAKNTFLEIDRSGRLIDEKTYATMARVHLDYGHFDKALDVTEQMRSKNISFSRFSCIVQLECCVLKGDLACAEGAFRAISKTGPPDATSCNVMLNLYVRLGLLQKANAFIREWIEECGIEFDEELFVSIVKVYCKGGMVSELERLIQWHDPRGTIRKIPFVRAFFMVMNGSKDYENFFEPSNQSGALAVELMVTLCLSAQDETKMEGKLELLLGTEIGESVSNRMITKFAKEGDELKTEYLYKLLIRNGCKIDDAATASMISLYGKQKKLKQAKRVFTDVAGLATDPKVVYSSMMEACIECGKERDAYLFYKELIGKGHNLGAVSISKLVKALTSCGRHRATEEVIANCFDSNSELDTVAYNTCIKAMLEAGKLRSAIGIYERILSTKISPSIQTYNTMISVYGRARDMDKVVEMFNLAGRMGVALDEKTYTNMICHYGKAGKVSEAIVLFSKMQEDGIKPGQMCYNVMINVYAADGLYIEAEKLLLRMKENSCFPDARSYLAVIRAYVKGSKCSEAENTIDAMQREGISSSCAHFNLLLSAYMKQGSIEDADRIYRKIRSTGLDPDPESKSIMLRGYVGLGLVAQGIDFFERECRHVGPDRFLSSAAVHLYRSAGEDLSADDILKSMNDLRVSFLNTLEVGSRA